jgi:hypothetical protein
VMSMNKYYKASPKDARECANFAVQLQQVD